MMVQHLKTKLSVSDLYSESLLRLQVMAFSSIIIIIEVAYTSTQRFIQDLYHKGCIGLGRMTSIEQ